jgi:NADP-dependent 3-hydroxy acid dehydrogenase YdfG
MTDKIILITGVSSGFGRAFAEAALREGYTVIGTVRNEYARKEFETIEPKRAKSLILDVTNFAAIAPSISKIEHEIGPVDVLVNNAAMVMKAYSKNPRWRTCAANSRSMCSAQSR